MNQGIEVNRAEDRRDETQSRDGHPPVSAKASEFQWSDREGDIEGKAVTGSGE